MSVDLQRALDQINGIVASTTAIVAMVAPLVAKLWRLFSTKEHVERVSGTLDILERVTRTNVTAVEQTEGKKLRDATTGHLTDEGRARLKQLAYEAIRHDYGATWEATAKKLDFTLEQLERHVLMCIEAVVFAMRAARPPTSPTDGSPPQTSPSSLPPFGGMTAAEKMAQGIRPLPTT